LITTDEQLAKERVADGDEREAARDESRPTGKAQMRRSIVWLQVVAFILGLGLLVYVINEVGVQPIFDALSRIGFGLIFLLAISGLRHLLRTFAMTSAIPPEHRRFTILQAFAVRLGGEAISFLTFTGPLLGEATKVALLRKRVPLMHGVPALVVDNLLYNFSVGFFILSGAVVMLISYDLPEPVSYTLIFIAAVALLGIIVAGLAVSRRFMLVTWLMNRIARLGFKRKRRQILHWRSKIHHVEQEAYSFYQHRPGSFFIIIAFNFLSHATSVCEVYLTLRMLGFKPQVEAAYVIESLTKVINFVFGFVPATIGVYEGGTEVILQTLGFAAATGVTLALVRKAGMIFWTSIGLCILTWRAVPNGLNRLIERSSRLQKLMDSLVFSNIAHRPARTAVSIFGIAVGVLLIVFTVGLAHGVLRERGRRESNIGAEIMLRPSGTIGLTTGAQSFTLPVSQASELARIEGVKAAVPIGQALDKTGSGFGSRLVDGIPFDEYGAITGLTIVEGRKLESGDEAIVDTIWQKDHQAAIGSTVELFERDFRIVGVYEPPGGGRVKIPLQTMQEQMGAEGHCSMILVSCVNPALQDEVAERIKARFPDHQIIFTRDLPEIYATGVPALNIFIKVVVAIAASISMLVILLAMYTTVTERTRQIGILKSLGMSKAQIAWVIEQEAIIVSILGVLVGVILTLAARFAVMRATTLNIEIEPRWILISLGIGLIGGTLGALYPALRAARQDAVEALSYE
jgi:putative ABC transport system permease protein